MNIAENGRISINGQFTGLGVTQAKEGTVVYTVETYNRFTNLDGAKYKTHQMPQVRYSLAHDKPASGAAGRADFERDLLALIASPDFEL